MVAAARPTVASAQAAPNPAVQSAATPQGGIPVFRVTVVGRTAPAINYRPRSGDTRIDFGGTVLLPKAKGSARVEGEEGVEGEESEQRKSAQSYRKQRRGGYGIRDVKCTDKQAAKAWDKVYNTDFFSVRQAAAEKAAMAAHNKSALDNLITSTRDPRQTEKHGGGRFA